MIDYVAPLRVLELVELAEPYLVVAYVFELLEQLIDQELVVRIV